MKTVLLIILQLAAQGGDAWSTARMMNSINYRTYHFTENDPLAVPFVYNTRSLVITNAIAAPLSVLAPLKLRKHHRRMAELIQWSQIAGNSAGMAYTRYRQ